MQRHSSEEISFGSMRSLWAEMQEAEYPAWMSERCSTSVPPCCQQRWKWNILYPRNLLSLLTYIPYILNNILKSLFSFQYRKQTTSLLNFTFFSQNGIFIFCSGLLWIIAPCNLSFMFLWQPQYSRTIFNIQFKEHSEIFL